MTALRVVGLGQRARGDDGVGLAVVEALAQQRPELEVHLLGDTSGLVELLDGTPTVVVDALLVGSGPGQLVEPSLEELEGQASLSTHGMDLVSTARLAEVLNGPTPLHILGVTILEARTRIGLSEPVQAAIPGAVQRLKELLDA